jgi:hypothetical protein
MWTLPTVGAAAGDLVGRLGDLRIDRPADLSAAIDQPVGR